MRFCGWYLLVVATLMATTACQTSRRGRQSLDSGGRVPAVAPESVPRSIYDLSNRVEGKEIPGIYLRDIVWVLFKPGTPQQDRQAAVGLVRGVVIGGAYIPSVGDGRYFVRIPGDGTEGPLLRALDALERMPQVTMASPVFMDETWLER